MNRANRREVLECASPLALLVRREWCKSARGLAQSKTLPRFWSLVLAILFTLARADAATNAADEIGVPKLVPPYSELPPTFWERHGLAAMIFGLAGLLIAGALVWFLRRSKPAVVLPPGVQARQALESLRPKAEDNALLSQVSRILREYLRTTFELPPDELTTTEFCRVLSSHEKVDAELAARASDFLRRCDERKFSAHSAVGVQASACSDVQSGSQDTLKRELQPTAAAIALELVALGEARRAQLSGSAGILPASSSTPPDETRRQDAGAPR